MLEGIALGLYKPTFKYCTIKLTITQFLNHDVKITFLNIILTYLTLDC